MQIKSKQKITGNLEAQTEKERLPFQKGNAKKLLEGAVVIHKNNTACFELPSTSSLSFKHFASTDTLATRA